MSPVDPPSARAFVSDASSAESVTPRDQTLSSGRATRDWDGEDLLWLHEGVPPEVPASDAAGSVSWLRELGSSVASASHVAGTASSDASTPEWLRGVMSSVATASNAASPMASASSTTFDDGAEALAALLAEVESEIDNTPLTKIARDRIIGRLESRINDTPLTKAERDRLLTSVAVMQGVSVGSSVASVSVDPPEDIVVDGPLVSGGGGDGVSVAEPVGSTNNVLLCQPCQPQPDPYPLLIDCEDTSTASTFPGYGSPAMPYVPPVLPSSSASTVGLSVASGSVSVDDVASATVPVTATPPGGEGDGNVLFHDTPVRTAPGPSATSVEVVINKFDRAKLDPGNYEDSKVLDKIREGLEEKFGVNSKDSLTSEKSEAGDCVQNVHVQVSATRNLDLIAQVDTKVHMYNMEGVLEVSPPKTSNPDLSAKVGEILDLNTTSNLLWDWQNISFDTVCINQELINTSIYVSPEDNQSSTLLYNFLQNSCTSSLKARIKKEFKQLPEFQKGGLTYLWLLLHTILRQTPGVSKQLAKFIELFSEKGPTLMKGNLYIGGKQLRNALSLLYGEGQLAQNTEKLLWTGAAKSKNTLLKGIAQNRIISAEEERIERSIFTAPDRSQKGIYDNCVSIVDKIEDTYTDQTAGGQKFADVANAQDNRFNNLSGRGGGGPGRGGAGRGHGGRGRGGRLWKDRRCFNCDERGHNAASCPKDRNEANLKKNYDEWKKNRGATTPATIPERTAMAQEIVVDGFTMAYCNACQSYVKDHSSSYHSRWSADKSTFNMFDVNPGHPLVTKNKAHFAALVAARASGGASAPSAGGGSANAQGISKLNAIFSQLEKRSADEDTVTLLNAARANLQDFR